MLQVHFYPLNPELTSAGSILRLRDRSIHPLMWQKPHCPINRPLRAHYEIKISISKTLGERIKLINAVSFVPPCSLSTRKAISTFF